MPRQSIIILVSLSLLILLSSSFLAWKIYEFETNKSSDFSQPSIHDEKKEEKPIITKKISGLTLEKGIAQECVSSMNGEYNSGYAKYGGKVYFQNYVLEGVDFDTFEENDDSIVFAKDKNYVYALGNPIKDMDPTTFEELKVGLARDKNNIYFSGWVSGPEDLLEKRDRIAQEMDDAITIVDCEELLGQLFGWTINNDGNRIVITGDDTDYVIEKMERLDSSSFGVVNDDVLEVDRYSSYIKDKDAVYFFEPPNTNSPTKIDSNSERLYTIVKIDGADSSSFEVVDKLYVKDRKAVYSVQYHVGLHEPGVTDPSFHVVDGSDPAALKIVKDDNPIRQQSHSYYFGITGEDDVNYYARDLTIPKDRLIVSWIVNLKEESMSCTEVCEQTGLTVAENACYDRNLTYCTVSKNSFCSEGGLETIVPNDYMTACCCSGAQFSWEWEGTDQVSYCISTDGLNPFVKGTTRSATNSGGRIDTMGATGEDECKGDYIIDYSCPSGATGLVHQNDLVCPNGCENGACLPLEEIHVIAQNEPQESVWEDNRIAFKYDPNFFTIKVTSDKMIHFKEKQTGREYLAISVHKITNGLTYDQLYDSIQGNDIDYKDVQKIGIGDREYIYATGIWSDSGKLVDKNYRTVIDNQYKLWISNNLAFHADSEEATERVERIIASIKVKNF